MYGEPLQNKMKLSSLQAIDFMNNERISIHLNHFLLMETKRILTHLTSTTQNNPKNKHRIENHVSGLSQSLK